ncbi:acetyltransferase [Flavobacterium sp.]|uniref:acetyltransferase n=1 Tax=Flavobacterium sp. TaxID=239 RepID=UPI00286CBFAE|nr:acetyltransferase [Flavobacterium sp.]
METKLILYGASGHCKVVIDILQNNNTRISSIVDENPNVKNILGKKVKLASQFDFNSLSNVILTIGNNKARKTLATKLVVNYATAIHSKAIVSSHAEIEQGTVIMAGAIINPKVIIGKHCIINTAAIVEHDCKIEDFVHISPSVSLAGGIQVGEGTHIGIGAIVIQKIQIGKWVTIGAGAVIINDIPDYAVVVGNPGKIIKYNTV